MTAERHAAVEVRIRAAIQQLTAGSVPEGLACDIKSLCVLAGVPRATFYRSYPHLKDEFEARRSTADGVGSSRHSDRDDRAAAEIARLRDRIGQLNTQIAELTAFQRLALSRLAAQHDEIVALRHRTEQPHAKIIDLVRQPRP